MQIHLGAARYACRHEIKTQMKLLARRLSLRAGTGTGDKGVRPAGIRKLISARARAQRTRLIEHAEIVARVARRSELKAAEHDFSFAIGTRRRIDG